MGAALGRDAGAAPLGLGAALGVVPALGAAAAPACACRRAMFIMRTSFTKFAIVTSGKLNAGIAPLPNLMAAAIC